MLKEHIDYLKDNPEGYWFKAKLYGWGWVPATREGWAITIVFVGLIFWSTMRFEERAATAGEVQVLAFLLQIFFMVVVLIGICYKTGEKPRWQWGSKNINNTD